MQQTFVRWIVGILIIAIMIWILSRMRFVTVFLIKIPFCWFGLGMLAAAYMLWFVFFRRRY